MPSQSFPITNHTPLLFTSEETSKIREYVSSRTIDKILHANIVFSNNGLCGRTEVVCSTYYGFNTFFLEAIFPPKSQSNPPIDDDLRHG